jgi:3-deoxy-D-manno-octulosonic acid kinase
MATSGAPLPADFTRVTTGRTEIVCATHVAAALRDAAAHGTIYEFAARHPDARALAGRGTAYALPLAGTDEHVVVRHNRHGGLFAPLTGDAFLPPTRAPLELSVSRRLVAHGVPTPLMLGYAVYGAPLGFRRVDVVTREVPNAFDLSNALCSSDATHRAVAIAATVDLVRALSDAGAHHADLNVKNVLLHPSPRGDGTLEALVLDLDRVVFGDPSRARERNLARLLRSAHKWRTRHGACVTQAELDELAGAVRERRRAPVPERASS